MTVDECWQKSLGWLARREYGRVELQRKLRHLGGDEDSIQAVLSRLESEGLQSDVRYAGSLFRRRRDTGKGPQYIRRELASAGVDEDIVNAVFAEHETDWSELCRDVLQRRFGNRPADNARELAKRQRFLFNRGFSGEHIRQALKEGSEE